MLVLDHQCAGLTTSSSSSSPYKPINLGKDDIVVGDLDSSDIVETHVDNEEEGKAVSHKTVLVKKQRFHPDLRTIRESPETIYTVSYIDMDEAEEDIEKEGIMVPEPEPATPGVTVLDIVQEEVNETIPSIYEEVQANTQHARVILNKEKCCISKTY